MKQTGEMRYQLQWVDGNGETQRSFVNAIGLPLAKPVQLYATTVTTPSFAERLEGIMEDADNAMQKAIRAVRVDTQVNAVVARYAIYNAHGNATERLQVREDEVLGLWFNGQRWRAWANLPTWAQAMREVGRISDLQLNGRLPF